MARHRSHGRRAGRVPPQRILVIMMLLAIIVILAVLAINSFNPSSEEEPIRSQRQQINTSTPVKTDEADPTPVTAFEPAAVNGTRPKDFGIKTEIQIDGKITNDYKAEQPIDFYSGDEYTDLQGIITFRGNNFRDSASFGTAKITEKTLDVNGAWKASVGAIKQEYGSGSWSGCGWTGQPLIVKWPQSTKKIMNMYDWAKADDALVEVIYATMDGHIYFFDLATGKNTRDSINLGFSFKGAGALDPRGYPLMYLGAGDDSPTKGGSTAFIVSLIDGKTLYEFGKGDSFALRDWYAFDSSALVDAKTDTLIYPSECGILYLIRLNTQYDEAAGTISIAPKLVKWRYTSKRSGSKGVNGSSGWWLGIEDSAIIWRGYAIFTDNGGNMFCLNLNTLKVAWVQDTLDDTNCTPVLELEGADKHPYIYTSTSFHAGWRAAANSTASIPIWKIDALNGNIVWTNTDHKCSTVIDLSGGVQGTLAIGKNKLSDMIFVPVAMTDGGKGKLVALSKKDGHEIWCCDFLGYPWSSPVTVYDEDGNGYIIQCNKSGYIHLIDGTSGTILYEASLGSNIEASPAIYNNTVVVGTRGGLIYGLKIK